MDKTHFSSLFISVENVESCPEPLCSVVSVQPVKEKNLSMSRFSFVFCPLNWAQPGLFSFALSSSYLRFVLLCECEARKSDNSIDNEASTPQLDSDDPLNSKNLSFKGPFGQI